MEQNKLEISFEIKKKHFYIVSGIFLVFIAAILVNAIPSNFWGHTGNDINVIIPQGTFDPVSNTEMSLQDAINGPTPYLNPDWRSSPKITYYSSHSDDDLGVDVPIGAHAACGMTDFYKYVGDSGGTIDANEVISFYLGLGIFDFSGFGDIFSSFLFLLLVCR